MDYGLVIGEFLNSNVGILIAGGGLFFTGWQFVRTRRQNQVTLFEGVYKDIRQLQKELGEIPNPTNEYDIEWQGRMKNWSALFFEALEWLSFLINTKEITKKELVEYFKPALIDWYEHIFMVWATDEQKTKDGHYPELKKLYKRFKR